MAFPGRAWERATGNLRSHGFALPPGCAACDNRASILQRPLPMTFHSPVLFFASMTHTLFRLPFAAIVFLSLPAMLAATPSGAMRHSYLVLGPKTAISGNTVIGSHAVASGVLMMEATPDKQIVWTSDHPLAAHVHHFQILTTNGKPEPGMPLK